MNTTQHIKKSTEAVLVLDAVQDFLASAAVKRLRPRTQHEYVYNLTVFGAWCGEYALVQNRDHRTWSALPVDTNHSSTTLHQVNAQVVHCFLEHLRQTRKPSRTDHDQLSTYTLAQYVKDIKIFLNWCVLDEQYAPHVHAIAVARIKKPKMEEVIIETFTPEQIEALFKACAKEESEHLQLRDRAILALLLDTGIRATELTTLTIGHVYLDTKDPHIRVYGKGGKWGEIGLGEEARRHLQKYIRIFRNPTIEHQLTGQLKKLPLREQNQVKRQLTQQERLFVNRAGKPLTKSGLEQVIARLGRWADVQGVRCSPHTFRHTFATMFIRNGGDIYTLSRLLRHCSVKVTEEYLKSLRQSEARRGAKSVLDNL